jgi:hypothetical protein
MVGLPTVTAAEPEGGAGDTSGALYAQPTPRWFYVHDDLSDEVNRRAGPNSAAAQLAQELLRLLRADEGRVTVLTLAEQIERVAGQGPYPRFETAIGIGHAGERVAKQLHSRTGWFPRVRRVGITREEDGRGGYSLVSTTAEPLAGQLSGLDQCRSLALVDDTVFSGLTIRGVIDLLPPALLSRLRVFCLRGVGETLDALATVCPVTVGVAARQLHQCYRSRAACVDPAARTTPPRLLRSSRVAAQLVPRLRCAGTGALSKSERLAGATCCRVRVVLR